MTDTTATATSEQLQQIVERVERLNVEKADIADTIKEVYAEAKWLGYDTAVLRKVIARRKRDRDALAEEDAVLEMYQHALGMV